MHASALFQDAKCTEGKKEAKINRKVQPGVRPSGSDPFSFIHGISEGSIWRRSIRFRQVWYLFGLEMGIDRGSLVQHNLAVGLQSCSMPPWLPLPCLLWWAPSQKQWCGFPTLPPPDAAGSEWVSAGGAAQVSSDWWVDQPVLERETGTPWC